MTISETDGNFAASVTANRALFEEGADIKYNLGHSIASKEEEPLEPFIDTMISGLKRFKGWCQDRDQLFR